MMCPSSTFRSFIDLYASRVQIDRAKTLTCRGRGETTGSPRVCGVALKDACEGGRGGPLGQWVGLSGPACPQLLLWPLQQTEGQR